MFLNIAVNVGPHGIHKDPDLLHRISEQLLPEKDHPLEPATSVSRKPVNAGSLPETAGRLNPLNATQCF